MFAFDARATPPAHRTQRRARRRALPIVLVALCACWLCRERTRERARESDDVALQREKSRSFVEPCIGDRLEASIADDPESICFATFAFARNAGKRWDVESTKTALRFMYSSLARSQARKPPRLHVYTDTPDVIPIETTFGTEVDVITHACDSHSFPANAYTNVGPWAALSRAKLDAVEHLMTVFGARGDMDRSRHSRLRRLGTDVQAKLVVGRGLPKRRALRGTESVFSCRALFGSTGIRRTRRSLVARSRNNSKGQRL